METIKTSEESNSQNPENVFLRLNPNLICWEFTDNECLTVHHRSKEIKVYKSLSDVKSDLLAQIILPEYKFRTYQQTSKIMKESGKGEWGSIPDTLYDELGIDKQVIETKAASLLNRRRIKNHRREIRNSILSKCGWLILLGILGMSINGFATIAETVVGDSWLKWAAVPLVILSFMFVGIVVVFLASILFSSDENGNSSSNSIWRFEPIIMDFIFDTVRNVGGLAVVYICIGVLFLEYDLSYLIDAIIGNIPILAIIGIIMTLFGVRNSRRS